MNRSLLLLIVFLLIVLHIKQSKKECFEINLKTNDSIKYISCKRR